MAQDSDLAADSLGMLFIGFTLATWMFGANTLQVYSYFQTYNDGFRLKLVVAIVFVSDMLNTIFTAWGIYMELVPKPLLPLGGNVPLVIESTASSISILVVQCFFAQAIYRLEVYRYNKWIALLIICLATLAFIGDIALTSATITTLYLAGDLKELPLLNEFFVAFTLGSVTLTDVIITVSLIWCLFSGKTSVKPTSNLLDNLIMYCVQRGILTTVSHVLVLALWFGIETEWQWTLFQFSLGKIYTFTFVTLLNRRESLARVGVQTPQGPSEPEFRGQSTHQRSSRAIPESSFPDVC